MPSAISPFPFSPTDRSLLTSLFDPASDLPATAAAHGLDLLDLAHWLAQPHIQAQVELIQSLRSLHHQVWADQLRHEAAEALREALRDATKSDPAERRRCATAILRATSLPRARRAGRARAGEGASDSIARRESAASRPPARVNVPPRAENPPRPKALDEASEMPAQEPPKGAKVDSPGRSESAEGGRSEPGVSVAHTAEPPKGAKVPRLSPYSNAGSPRAAPPDHAHPTEPDAQARAITPSSPSSESLLAQALATLRASGYDVSDHDDPDDLDDDAIDALEDAELDAIDDAELDDFAANLTDADIAEALRLADQFLADPHDTS